MKIILIFTKFFLSFRYKVNLVWKENLLHNWPVLILPNHVALVDPQILIVFLWKYLKVSPLASEAYYKKPWLKQVMDLFWTVPIWEISKWANIEDVEKVFSKVVDGLKNNKNILIYPSGQIYRQWFESIIWKQSVYNIVNLMPDNVKIIWIKTRWLWWSIWSKAWDNWETWFFTCFLSWVRILIANLFVFTPKREVRIEIKDLTKDILELRKNDLNTFNKYLEDFYNTESWEKYVEPAKYIKHYFYLDNVKNKKEPEIISGSIKELNLSVKRDLSKIDQSIILKIFDKIALIKSIDKNIIKWDSNLILDLFFDSLDLAEIKSYIQANFKWSSNPPILDLKTVWDLVFMAIWESKTEEKMKPCNWWKDFSGNLMLEKLI